MGEVAGVEDKFGAVRQGVDACDGGFEGAGDVFVGFFVKADVGVADLDELEVGRRCGGDFRARGEGSRGQQAAGDGPYHAGAGPGHAFEKTAPVDAVGIVVVFDTFRV